jgi:hypothetical protein
MITMSRLLLLMTAVTLDVFVFVFGCGDAGDDTSQETDTGNGTDTERELDTEPLVTGACTEENILGSWELNYPKNEFVEAHTEQYIFREDGTYENTDTIGGTMSGTWALKGREMELTVLGNDEETFASPIILVVTCASVGEKLYVDADMVTNPDAEVDSLDGTWSEHVSSNTWDATISMVVDGDDFTYEEVESGEVLVSAGGKVRRDGNNVYWTYTSEDIDRDDQVELDQEELLGIRIAVDVIFWTSDESENPADSAYTKID